MGVSKNTYIGPYFELSTELKLTEVQTDSARTCTNKECVVHQDKKHISDDISFCPKCGSKIDEIEFLEEKEVTAKDFFEDKFLWDEDSEYFEELMSTDPMCGLSNEYGINKSLPKELGVDDIDDYEGGSSDLSNIDIRKAIEWTENEFKDLIDEIRSKFGSDEAVKVKFGVIVYWS